MRRTKLPISALPAWCKLNDVTFLDTTVKEIEGKGLGLVTDRSLSSQDTFDTPTLLIVPNDLVLSANAIEEHAKVDHHFRQLLDAAGGKSSRGDVLLFLLMQVTISSLEHGQTVGLSNPLTEFVKMLPDSIPVPTMWSEEERVMLMGTSLESALNAKLIALNRELETIRENTAEIPWCQKCWWEHDSCKLADWILLDAWYRSRCLELPVAGEAMVPCVDFANHSASPNSYYEQKPDGSAALLLRPGFVLDVASEITISYGESKSAAEMLFSYGFVDEESTTRELVLTIEPFPDDPLGKAKLAAFDGPPVVRVFEEEGNSNWESPFLYLMCLNEEDGLDFRVLQQTDGSRTQLRMFWQGNDVTNESSTFEALTSSHELKDVFRLRAIALLQDRIRQQLERLYESEDTIQSLLSMSLVNPDRHTVALQLRAREASILEAAFTNADRKKKELLEAESILRYLGSMDASGAQEAYAEASPPKEDDFS